MIFTDAVAQQIASSMIRTVFRRWQTRRVKVGSRILTSAGVIRIDDIVEISSADLTEDDAHAAGEGSLAQLLSTLHGAVSDPVYRINLSYAGPDPRIELRSDDDLSADAIAEIDAALRRLDHKADSPWTRKTLQYIADNPGKRAADIAQDLGATTKEQLKLRVRKLKNLGLTESLDTGYRISPRGRRYLELTVK
ncbi:hypothetical protein [Nocardia amamiensis]|uniref:hypothetical protein n=1 Tax=Nocardia amamiensis TaxID=404578 RepID=UPI0008378D2B|nr:hypothetical protein [Nocardia amamiensis]